jgi:predicted alpha/beta hydrolase family esterase
MTTAPILIIPGLGNSGPAHWQTLWENQYPHTRRVIQRDWEAPDLSEWIQALEQAIADCASPPLLVAHSLACALVAHWAQKSNRLVQGAFLVSPSDVDSAAHTPDVVRCFSPLPRVALPFPSLVVASSNDPYVDLARAEQFAQAWQSRFVNIGALGHINANSGLGDWPQGKALFEQLL